MLTYLTFTENTHSVYIFLKTYDKAAESECVRPAKGVQTLSKHDALFWLQGREADGTHCLGGAQDKVLFLCRQKMHVVPVSFLLLSLRHAERELAISAMI